MNFFVPVLENMGIGKAYFQQYWVTTHTVTNVQVF